VDGFDHETCGVYGQNCNVTICYYQNRWFSKITWDNLESRIGMSP
jgi:hypothetical protein